MSPIPATRTPATSVGCSSSFCEAALRNWTLVSEKRPLRVPSLLRAVDRQCAVARVYAASLGGVPPVVRAQVGCAPCEPVEVAGLHEPPRDVAAGSLDVELARGGVPEQMPEPGRHGPAFPCLVP